MNFKTQINKTIEDKTVIRECMIAFSLRIQMAMNLEYSDILLADKEEVVWSIPGYEITARSFPWNSRISLLIATPSGTSGRKLGYTNCEETTPPKWHLKKNGTGTTFYPDMASQDKIINTIIGF